MLVVDFVRPDHPNEIRITGYEPDFHPTMNQNVMKQDVKNAIAQNAISNPFQEGKRLYLISNHQCQNGWNAENDGKKVVSLKKTMPWAVVRFVPGPKESMHDVPMGKPGHSFHKQKGRYQNKQIDYQIHFRNKFL